MYDRQQRLIISNARYAEIYGIDPEKIRPGMFLKEVLELRVAAGAYHDDPASYISRRNAGGRKAELVDVNQEFIQELVNGRVVQMVSRLTADGGWVSTHEDITEKRRNEARIQHMARHDALTDLPNRSFLKERISEGLSWVRRGDEMAVLCMDLDRFKAVNDTRR
jgi:PAS domain-containing protein